MASAPFAPPDLRRCALRKARAGRSRSRRRREGGSCCRHRRHHVLPRQEEHPADHGEWGAGRGRLRLSLARCSLRRGRGALDPAGYPGPVPGEGRGPGVRGWRAAVSPAGAPGATQTERPWRLGENKTKRKPIVARRTLDYVSEGYIIL